MKCLSSDEIMDWFIPRLLMITLIIGIIFIFLFFQGCDFMGGMDTGYQKGGQYYNGGTK